MDNKEKINKEDKQILEPVAQKGLGIRIFYYIQTPTV